MDIFILIDDEKILRTSADGKKMQQIADEYNGGSDVFGPYMVVQCLLEDYEK